MTTTPTPARTAKPFSFRRVFLLLVALLMLTYLADFVQYTIRAHFPKLGSATGSVHRVRMLAIPEKNNKVEYQIDAVHPEEDVRCTHSIFPHSGNRPCWYVTRHANDPITM
jgi:uncharacterized membrane protein